MVDVDVVSSVKRLLINNISIVKIKELAINTVCTKTKMDSQVACDVRGKNLLD